ncbi:hypothetical protein DPMN_074054 [Dreissena polymorpha]|uniref:DNA2/NAM7 helicase-like C-terminal domain-containing protein n=1 Tax=Dreissena polymorpha TaxID=45954 RepID=A0A9D3YGY3_DREPO|nr:hypothetical protein DPMN_074054 [Dreissena polymorpha]
MSFEFYTCVIETLKLIDRFLFQHPRICDLPSELFYEGRLQTARNVGTDKPLPIWPEHETLGTIPRVFVHLVGNEEMLTVSTEDGNEMSKSNAVEVDYVVSVFFSNTMHQLSIH